MFPPFVTELTIRVLSVQTGINERCLVPKYQFARYHAVRAGRGVLSTTICERFQTSMFSNLSHVLDVERGSSIEYIDKLRRIKIALWVSSRKALILLLEDLEADIKRLDTVSILYDQPFCQAGFCELSLTQIAEAGIRVSALNR
jgi:hypothetical protein